MTNRTRAPVARCDHGFIRRYCTVTDCPHYEGLGRGSKVGSIPCGSCSGPMKRGRKEPGDRGRICSRCEAMLNAERARREAQEAWLAIPKGWFR